jgi:hypothetical protein
MVVALTVNAPAPPVVAHEGGELVMMHSLTVAPSSVLAFEAAIKKHNGVHERYRDPWRWDCWQLIGGPQLGTYVIRTEGRRWEDMGGNAEFRAVDREDFFANVAPHLTAMSGSQRVLVSQVGHRLPSAPDPKLIEFHVFRLEPAEQLPLGDLEKVSLASHGGSQPKDYSWYRWVTGEGAKTVVELVIRHDDWATLHDFEERSGTLFRPSAAEKTGRVGDLIRRLERVRESYLYVYRSDLTYKPPTH